MRAVPFFVLILAAVAPVRAASTPLAVSQTDARARWLELAKPLWEKRLAQARGRATESAHYPTEPALVFLTAYELTRETRFAEQAKKQLEYAHGRGKDGLLLTPEGVCGRDYQARQIYNFYVAFRILDEEGYLKWADDAASAMLKHIPRSPYACRGQTHTLFTGDLLDAAGHAKLSNPQRIDPNQNAEIALAFSLLYHDRASGHFHNPAAREIAAEELLASMSLQDMTTGEIPLTGNLPGADTAYGAYAACSWTWCQLLWHDDRFEPHIQVAGRWLGIKTDLTKDCTRFYPSHQHGRVPSWQANYCIPLFWYCKIDAAKFIADLRERTAHPEQTPGDDPAPLYWAYFDVMGVPRAFYLEGVSSRAKRGTSDSNDSRLRGPSSLRSSG
jgi:hypothetical protein